MSVIRNLVLALSILFTASRAEADTYQTLSLEADVSYWNEWDVELNGGSGGNYTTIYEGAIGEPTACDKGNYLVSNASSLEQFIADTDYDEFAALEPNARVRGVNIAFYIQNDYPGYSGEIIPFVTRVGGSYAGTSFGDTLIADWEDDDCTYYEQAIYFPTAFDADEMTDLRIGAIEYVFTAYFTRVQAVAIELILDD